MNTKTMEGLVGARTNMDLLNTPMRVYKEARNRGDMATMKRSMEYVVKFADKADEYKAEADKGMEEEAEEARKRVKAQREEIIEKRKEESEKQKERIEESRKQEEPAVGNGNMQPDTAGNGNVQPDTAGNGNVQPDIVEISETGKDLFESYTAPVSAGIGERKTGVIKEPVTYTKTGETVQAEQNVNISVSV
ncbi:MAG: hypothetical protein HFG80_15190 [Eubacterium sp.]|nr:hypothetical protein [Eubacterium sp.]